MKKIILTFLSTLLYSIGFAQVVSESLKVVDSLKHQLVISKNDTSRVWIMTALCHAYASSDFDSAATYGNRSLALARRIKFVRGEIIALYPEADALNTHGEIPQSFELNFKGLQMAHEINYTYGTALGLFGIANDYWDLQDYPKAISFYKSVIQILNTTPNYPHWRNFRILQELNIGWCYSNINKLDSALFYLQGAYDATLTDSWHAPASMFLGDLLFKKGQRQKAFTYLHQSILQFAKDSDFYSMSDAYGIIARFFEKTNQPDSAIFYAKKGLANAQKIGYKINILGNAKLLADEYERKDIGQAHAYLKLVTSVNEELFGSKKVRQLQEILSEEQEKQRKISAERVAYQNRLKEYAFLAGLAIMLLIAFILYRNNQREKKGKRLLEEKNQVIEKTLTDLKATQTQLIQTEKMASLGELTAGIAHEIQNPLNFVNNFSEVSVELIDEMEAELKKGETEEAIDIAADVKQNLEKIRHHGKRADAIVKGMLAHSQSGSGTKEPTNINSLADEYMRLAYHGLRAKDKSFNAELITDFDEKLPKVNVIPQDMGRVLLNLFNNAFYAVNQKQKTVAGHSFGAGAGYKPEVSVSTSVENNSVVITVKDNGNGIPDAIKEKIMQPFFTTKPTGEGTGLGLSLTYDMVVKGHGGSIDVNSKEGEFTEFIIQLPVK